MKQSSDKSNLTSVGILITTRATFPIRTFLRRFGMIFNFNEDDEGEQTAGMGLNCLKLCMMMTHLSEVRSSVDFRNKNLMQDHGMARCIPVSREISRLDGFLLSFIISY